MARNYTLKRRAEQQAETRRRIVEATIELHGTIGPALTNTSMIAERAGVQRHTVYAHFPDEWSLLLACSGLHYERDPLPNADEWRNIEDRRERLRVGLDAIYTWYERNANLLACVMRDREHHAATKKIGELRFAPVMRTYHEVLGAALNEKQRAVLQVMLSFYTWRTLVRESGLDRAAAVDVAVQAIDCVR